MKRLSRSSNQGSVRYAQGINVCTPTTKCLAMLLYILGKTAYEDDIKTHG